MATEYHLLTCLGQGVTATLTIAAPCVVTYNASGMRSGHPVVWEANGDTLPTGLTHGTTCYVRPIDANTFHLYDTEAHAKDTGNTTGRIDTSGSQSGTHKLVGDYWYRLPAADPGGGGNYRGRYLYGGSYQVFGTWNTWHTGRSLRANYSTELTLEIEGKWTCLSGGWINVDQIAGFFSCTITTKLRGVWGSGYHGGVPGAGWVQACGAYNRISGAKIVEGIEIDASAYADNTIAPAPTPTIRHCIFSLHPSYRIFANIPTGTKIIGNIIIGGSTGILIGNYSNSLGSVIANNLIVGAGTGFDISTSASGVFIANNAAIGCTIANWGATPPSSSYLGYNAGVSGDTPWANSGEPSVTSLTTAHFVDYANGDYRPTSDSPLIDAGSQVFSSLEPVAVTNALDADNGDPRPSYKGGAATDWDIGPFEYDHGYGLAPMVVDIAIAGMIEGSVLAIYRTSDHAEIVAPTTIGASGACSTTHSWTGNVSITVVVRKATGGTKYLPYSAPGLITSGGFRLVVSQVEDLVLNG